MTTTNCPYCMGLDHDCIHCRGTGKVEVPNPLPPKPKR